MADGRPSDSQQDTEKVLNDLFARRRQGQGSREHSEIPSNPRHEPAVTAPVSEAAATDHQHQIGPRESDPEATDRRKLDKDYVLLLDAIDKLKLDSDFDLPEIVVLGEQSEGKSTVLEAIAGVKLPKGDRLCTKCLIRLCIRERSDGTEIAESAIVISFDGKETQVGNQTDLSSELKKIMDEAVPEGISMKTVISVKVFGRNRPNLTVIDVPGFTRELDKDVENMTEIESRIANPNVIMVVVLKALNDTENSKGYDLAKKIDPKSQRTVFVLTHCDNLPENKQKMVTDMVNDSQAFAVNCYAATGEFSPDGERAFFSKSSFWRKFPSSRLGIASLTWKLTQIMHSIVSPRKREIESKIRDRWSVENEELQRLKTEKVNLDQQVAKMLQNIAHYISNSLKGSHSNEKNKFYSECRSKWAAFKAELHKKADEFRSTSNLLEMITEEYQDQPGRELDSLVAVNPVLERIVQRFIAKVDPYVRLLISDIDSIAQEHMKQVVETNLKDHEPLRKFVGDSIRTNSLELNSEVTENIMSALEMESVVYRTVTSQANAGSTIHGVEQSGLQESEETDQGLLLQAVSFGVQKLPPSIRLPAESLLKAGQIKEVVQQFLQHQDVSAKTPEAKHKEILLTECSQYIVFVENRVADTIPKAFVQFMFKPLEKKIWEYVICPIDEDTKKKMSAAIDSNIQRLDLSLCELNNLLKRF